MCGVIIQSSVDSGRLEHELTLGRIQKQLCLCQIVLNFFSIFSPHFSNPSSSLLTHLSPPHYSPTTIPFDSTKRNATWRVHQELLLKPTPLAWIPAKCKGLCYTPTHNGSGCTAQLCTLRRRPPPSRLCTSLHSCFCCLLSGLWVNTNTAQQEQGILLQLAVSSSNSV